MGRMSTLRRLAPALLLLVLAPFVAEFLLGDFSVRNLALLLVLLPQYGGGALLIREVARRTHRGWAAIVLLAVAYALVEEGFTTQSLFNPNYVGQHLLAYGYVPALGTSPVWTVYVLSIHVVWSVSTPILIAEGIAGTRRTTPWLGRLGLGVVGALFLLGCATTTLFTLNMDHFVASVPQFVATGVLVIAAVAAAFAVPAGTRQRSGTPPPPWLVGAAVLVLASAFQLALFTLPGLGAPAAITLLAMLACEAAGAALIVTWSRLESWGPSHLLGIAAGAALTYSWLSLAAFLRGKTHLGAAVGAVEIAGQVVEVLLVLGLIAWAARRLPAVPEPAAADTSIVDSRPLA
jgi:hypothetical protein